MLVLIVRFFRIFFIILVFLLVFAIDVLGVYIWDINRRVGFVNNSGKGITKSYIGLVYFDNFLKENGVWNKGLYNREAGDLFVPAHLRPARRVRALDG